jgi:membrane associated rhomboid family serine protease
MAGRFSFSVPGRRNAGDPWFRIGTLDVGTTILVILLCVASMFLWAINPDGLWRELQLIPAEVRGGEVWRLVTWPIANEASLWVVITLAIFWYFGREVEGMVGRVRFAILLLLLTVIPGIFGVLLDIGIAGLEPVELAVFLIFIAEYPYVRFFFGIPAWAIGAVIVGITILQYMAARDEDAIILLFVSIATAALTARSMGLAQSLPWIPKIPWPGSGSGSRRRRPATRGGGDVVTGPWTTPPRSGPARGTPLPQPPPPTASDRDQAELDMLLDKISANGMDGLSADEKRKLNELSKRLRNRR